MFDNEVHKKAIQHALDVYPKEACGLIIDNGSEYIPFDNIHETPKIAFRMDKTKYLEYLKDGRISALIHSHTGSGAFENKFPSRLDMQAQEQMQIPWGIIYLNEHRDIDGPFYFGEQVPIAPLVGRTFRPNVHDCYTLTKDKYWIENKIRLPVYPREGLMSDVKANFLEKHMLEHFERIDRSQARPDDLMLGIVNAPRDKKVLNHIMIIRERGLILHHLEGRLSKEEPLQMWVNTGTVFLRYKGAANA